ncbi:MAG: hypothetical protein ACRDBO_19675 [Lachnospiraceae bacterium]
MLSSKKALEMEQELKESISLGFFEHGTHDSLDLTIYEAYASVQMLRIILEEFEKVADDAIKEALKEGE